jgi:hypothetical protein
LSPEGFRARHNSRNGLVRGMLSVALALSSLLTVALAHCPHFCNGHGRCTGINKCECFANWGGGDCSLRLCPVTTSWNDVATSIDGGHNRYACSDRGLCDHSRGVCQCQEGFEGAGCQRLACPNDCGGHGQCKSMRVAAQYRDESVNTATYTTNWDADMIHGCDCDVGFHGYACELRTCPFGDDPMTGGQVDEVQLFRCDLDPAGGQQFTFRFRKETTVVFSASSSAAEVEAALEGLSTIDDVQVTYLSALGTTTTFCANPTSDSIIRVTFLTEHGDVPRLLLLGGDSKPLSGAAASGVASAFDGASLTRGGGGSSVLSVQGDKEWIACSARGMCDTSKGACVCYKGFGSSDQRGSKGSYADCGFAVDPITSCPGQAVECSGHGWCSGHPEYRCTCDQGWTGGDCAERTCPTGASWFDLPTTNNRAHALAECSNRGTCDRSTGECVCQKHFTGEACQQVECPGTLEDGRTCNGHGTCYTMDRLAQEATTNGVHTPFTYGGDRNKVSTWDWRSSQGCICYEGWEGYDCSLRTCPAGDDPTTAGQVDEVQSFTCEHLSGTPEFQLQFRRKVTAPIAYDATAAEVEAALEALDSIGDLTVQFDDANTRVCSTGSTTTVTISYHSENGPLPPLEILLDQGHTNGVDLNLPPTGLATEVSKGTTENEECSGRGLCNHTTGNCECFIGFGSSDGSSGKGGRGDCGYREPYTPEAIDQNRVDARTATNNAWAKANGFDTY